MIRFVFGAILALVVGVTTVSCFSDTAAPPGKRMVLTSKDNVKEEAFAKPGEVVELKVEDLRGDVGNGLKQVFAERNSTPVITVEENLKPLSTDPAAPRPIMVILDRQTTEELFSSDFVEVLLGTIGVNLPGPWQPYLIALGGIIGLFNKRFRTHAATAAQRTVPGIQGPENDGRIPNLNDLGEGLVDLMKAVTFRPTKAETEILVTDKALNG